VRSFGDSRNRQEEASLQFQVKKVTDREAAVEDRQHLLDEKERLLRSAERALQRRLGELEDDAGRLASEARRVDNQRMRLASDTTLAWNSEAPRTSARGCSDLDSAVGLSARLAAAPAPPPVGLSAVALDRAWRPTDIETESLSRLGLAASQSFSQAPSQSQPQGEVLATTGGSLASGLATQKTALPAEPSGPSDTKVGIAASAASVIAAALIENEDEEFEATLSPPRAKPSGVAQQINGVGQSLKEMAPCNAGNSAGQVDAGKVPPSGDGADFGCGLLAAARDQRRRLRREKTALEADKQRWFEDSSRAFDPGADATATARSRELLAEVKVALDARAHRVAEDLREARAVERMLINWHRGGVVAAGMPPPAIAAAGVQAPPPPPTATVGASNVGGGAVNSADLEMARVAWEEEALLRHWQDHLAAWPASMRTAPMSARPVRSSSNGMPSRSLTARSAAPAMQKSSRRRPLSARERQAWPAELLSAREPLSARGVMAGHAAWLQGFHQQLGTGYDPSAYNYTPQTR